MNPNDPLDQKPAPLQQPLSVQPPVDTPFMQVPSDSSRKRSLGKFIVLVLLVMVAIAIVVIVVFWQKNRQPTSQNLADSQATVTEMQAEEKTSDDKPEYTMTNCYRFIAPEGYTVSVDATACKVKLTHQTMPTSVIEIQHLSGLEKVSGSVVEYSIGRTKLLAEQQKLEVGGTEMLDINDYTTGVLYFVNANKQKKAFYAIDNVDRKSKAAKVESISVFTVTGVVDTEQQSADVRLVVSSFVIQ